MKKKPLKRPKIRKTWKINPGTRIIEHSNKQDRLSAKQELKNIEKRLNDEKDT